MRGSVMYIVDIEKSMYEYVSRKMLFLAKNIKYVKAMEKISDVWNGIKRFLHQKSLLLWKSNLSSTNL